MAYFINKGAEKSVLYPKMRELRSLGISFNWLESEVFLAGITENDHKKSGDNFG